MNNKQKLTIKIIKNTNFNELYRRFLINKDMSSLDYKKMLSLAIIFINYGDINVKKLGHRIITIYSNRTKDFLPLYEISINKGLYPISKCIEDSLDGDEKENFFTEFNSALIDSFYREGKYLTNQQDELLDFYDENMEESVSIVAPTSYGKTDLIVNTVNMMRGKRICILTPTKALLAQTKQRIQSQRNDAGIEILTHPDMFRNNIGGCVAVLTQERLMTLLRKNKDVYFDCVVVDEAHEIFDKNDRSEILARDIIVLNKRNNNTVFKYLSPFIVDDENLNINHTSEIIRKLYKIDEYVKTEKIYIYDIKNKKQKLYDQFIDELIECRSFNDNFSDLEYIQQNSSDKNIIYFNKPKDIEEFAKIMIEKMPDIDLPAELNSAIKDIAKYVDPEYTLVKCLKKGIIYHHASIPDSIRSYIENIYRNYKEIKYIITSSTLLEGVNLPATRLFIMDRMRGRHNMTASEFRNLSGRICRFSEIFNKETGDLSLLEPEIHIVFGKYFRKNTKIENYIKSVMKIDKKIIDKVENPLMCNVSNKVNEEKKLRADEILENFEHGTIENYSARSVNTKVGEICIGNNINEIDIFTHEKSIEERIEKIGSKIKTVEEAFDYFCNIFLDFIDDKEDNITRLRNVKAREFYKKILTWKYSRTPFKAMISYFVQYWKYLRNDENEDKKIYVGKWGDLKRGGNAFLWTDVSNKTDSELVNLAIVRIKEEMDFVDNVLMKYIEVFNELEILDENLYMQLKYNTTDKKEMIFIMNGYSLELSKLILDKYNKFLDINEVDYSISIAHGLIGEMRENEENLIIINEARNIITD